MDIPYLKPATEFELTVVGFTQKREGLVSPVLVVRTDTAKPGPPTITNTNCSGKARPVSACLARGRGHPHRVAPTCHCPRQGELLRHLLQV